MNFYNQARIFEALFIREKSTFSRCPKADLKTKTLKNCTTKEVKTVNKIALIILTVIMMMPSTATAKSTAKKTSDINYSDQTNPAREKEYLQLTRFFGTSWKLDTKDVFCATINPLSCHDRLEFAIKAKGVNHKEFDKAVKIWKEWGRKRELRILKHPDYRLAEVAVLFGFPREKGMPDNLQVVFYYKGDQGSDYDSVQIYNDNLGWFPTIFVCVANTDVKGSFSCNENVNTEIHTAMKTVKISYKK